MGRSPHTSPSLDLVKYEVEETKRWVKQRLAEIRREEATNVPYCFKCGLPLANGIHNGVEYCACRIPDVMGASLVKLRSTEPVLQLFDIERNNRADEMERLQLQFQIDKLKIEQAQLNPHSSLSFTTYTQTTSPVSPRIYECKDGSCGYVPSLAEQHQDIGKGFSFKDPSAKSAVKEPVDTNYTGKSVLSYLLALPLKMVYDIVEELNIIGKRDLLFISSGGFQVAIGEIVRTVKDDKIAKRIAHMEPLLRWQFLPKETVTPPYYEEDIVQPIIK